MITYNSAPLPFQGQKRRFVKKFREILRAADDFGYIFDVFGGSGLLAHNAKQVKPNAKVVYNDFDGYRGRLSRIKITNAVLAEVKWVLDSSGVKKDKRVPKEVKAEIVGVLQAYDLVEPLDCLSLSSSLLFSGNYAAGIDDLVSHAFYNCCKSAEGKYSAQGYLEGVEVMQSGYAELIAQADPRNTLLLLDPPYLSTDASRYTNMEYWHLSKYLGLVEGCKGFKFIYFSSNKSEIFQLTDYLDATMGCYTDPFKGCRFTYSNAALGGAGAYTDIMVDNL